ncbi:hypothetical protein L914_01975, partial [Phytophthora nicotianae]
MAGFTIHDGEDPPAEPLAPQLPVEAGEGLPTGPLPTATTSATQDANPRRPRPRFSSHAGGPFALPRRDYPGDVDIDMVDVSGDGVPAEEKEETPPSKR